MTTKIKANLGTKEAWKSSRSGAWAGRGFHYQHLVSTLLLLHQWAGFIPSGFLVPEGLEDSVLEYSDNNHWLQIKSRKDKSFSKTEVGKILAGVVSKASKVRSGSKIQASVILEQPCVGVAKVSISAIFDEPFQNIFVCVDPGEECVSLLVVKLDIAEIIAEGIVSDLYRLVADASQLNGSRSFDDRRKLSTTEVERRIFERLEAEDPSKIDLALFEGVLEPVDFYNPIDEPAFYQGVKVNPGHVVAGLVLDRPEDLDRVISAIRQTRQVLISGPSGAGKSALLWLSVNSLAGECRWFKVTARASTADADSIIRFVRARQPNEASPIGLAYDEIGSINSDLWDILVRELRGVPSVYFLGSVRQEDTNLIANQADTKFISVCLDERLAERVWQELRTKNQTSWAHWKEPFEQSDGLMLEYTHLLTRGERLAAIVKDQVRQRQKEGRDHELAIIRSTSVLCANGGEVQASKLFKLLNLNQEDAGRALARLVDEHLVRESRPGVLGGLHHLRSKALCSATHDETIFLESETLWGNLQATTTETLPRVVHKILSCTNDGEKDRVLRKLAGILESDDNISTWVSIFTGLGLATLEHHVKKLIEILERHNVQRAQWSLASMYADPELEIPEMEGYEQWQTLRNALLDFRAQPISDLRSECVGYFSKKCVPPSCQTLREANQLLSCLAPICGSGPVPIKLLPNIAGIGSQDIHQVAKLLSTAYLVDHEIAENLVQELGGEKTLFDWFYTQTPWVTEPIIISDGRHGRTVRADLFYISDDVLTDPHETVCNICEVLIALSPKSEAAASDAINVAGQLIEIGDFQPWSKNMPRANLIAKTRVAWNVAFRQILLAKAAADSLTEYTQGMSAFVRRTEKVFRLFTEKWVKGKSISNRDALAAEINDIINSVNALAYAVPAQTEPDMTTPAANAGTDDTLGALLTGVLGNLMGRIGKVPGEENARAVACYAGALAAQAQTHKKSVIWRTLLKPPIRELEWLSDRLKNTSSILHEIAYDGTSSSIQRLLRAAKKGTLGRSIHAASRHCNTLSETRFKGRLKALELALRKGGRNANCRHRIIDKLDSVYWPAKKVAILIEINDFETDRDFLEDALALGQLNLGSDWLFTVVPIMNGLVLAPMALCTFSQGPIPDQNFSVEWQNELDEPFFKSDVLDHFDNGLSVCFQISGILACRDLENLRPVESESLSDSIEAFEVHQNYLEKIAGSFQAEHMELASDYLDQIWNEVVGEYETVKAGNVIEDPLNMGPQLAISGQQNDQSDEIATVRILVLQGECRRAAGLDQKSLSDAS